MIDDIYNAKILEFAGNIGHLGHLENPMATATTHSKLCGSTVTVDLSVSEGVVSSFAHEVKACALGQASAAIMANTIIGSKPDELRALKDAMYAMLKEDGPPPEGRFEDAKFLQPVKDYKARQASCLLPFDAVVDALDQIEADGSAAA